MSRFQFNLLFAFVLAGAVFVLGASSFGLHIDPAALTGYGVITTYVLTQKNQWTKNDPKTQAAEAAKERVEA